MRGAATFVRHGLNNEKEYCVVYKVFFCLEKVMDETQRMLDYIAECNQKLEKQAILIESLQKENEHLLKNESEKLRDIRWQMKELWRHLFVQH